MVGHHIRAHPCENSMLCHFRSHYASLKIAQSLSKSRASLGMNPPTFASALSTISLSYRSNNFSYMLKRLFVQSSFLSTQISSKVNNPDITMASHNIHPTKSRLHDIRIRSSIWIMGCRKHLLGSLCVDIERSAFHHAEKT